MLILKIIDSNNNCYYPQKIKDFNFQKIHYGNCSQLSCILEENPSFQNHKVELFNNIYLYYYSNLIWQGYITEFQRDYKNLNYNLKASGLLIDFQNKRIKKTYVLDDIGDFKNWNEKNSKESDEILYGYSQAKEDKGVKISLLQQSYNAEEDGVFELKIDENIERLKARMFINQPANFTTKLITLDENHSNPTEEKKWENAQKVDEDVILDITKVGTGSGTFTKKIYPSDDSYTRSGIYANNKYGSGSDMGIKEIGANDVRRAYLKFPTTDIPTDATIISATLKMYERGTTIYGSGRGYRCNANWVEGTITHNNAPGNSGSLLFTLNLKTVGWKIVDIKNSFQGWWNGSLSNYGIRIFRTDTGQVVATICAKEWSGTSLDPYIEVVYTAPTGVVEINKRYLQFRVECTTNQVISTDKYFAQLENLKLLTSDDEINAANILKDLLLNYTQKLDLDTTLIQDCFNYGNIELCESLNGWEVDSPNVLTLSLENSIIKEGSHSVKTIVPLNASSDTYQFDFSFDDGKWVLSNAVIAGGILDITVNNGYGQRVPDNDWLSDISDDFIIEIRFKQDFLPANQGVFLVIKLVGDANTIRFDHFLNPPDTRGCRIVYNGVQRASTSYTMDTNWHTAKIRRVGTTYYFRFDTATEVSWDYGTAREVEWIRFQMVNCTGHYDDFEFFYKEIGKFLTKTLSPIQNLQNKNLFRLWVYSTITGDILKAKFGENVEFQYNPEWTVRYEGEGKPPDADPAWTLIGTDYGVIGDWWLGINKTAANECSYKREDVGHNIKGNTIVTRMKCTNAAKTTFIQICDGIAKVTLAIYTTKIEDWNDAANVYTIDMTKWRNLWLTIKNNFFILYVDGVFALCGETQTTTDKWFKFGMDSSANLGISYWDYVYYYNLGFLRNKRIEKIISIKNLNLNPSIEVDTSEYSSQASTISRDTVEFYHGIASLKCIANNAGINEGWYRTVTAETSAETEYTFSVYLKGSGTVILRFYDATADFQDSSIITLTDTWTRYSLTATFGTGADRLMGVATDVQQSITFYSDAIMHQEGSILTDYDGVNSWKEFILDLNNFPIATRDAIKYIQFEILTNDAFTFYIDQIRSNFELTSAYYRDRTAPLNILEDVLAYQDYEWTITKDKKVEFFEVDRDEIDYICPIRNLVFEENSTSYFSKIYLVYFDEMMKRQEIELTDENSEIPFDKEHVIGLGGISDVGAKAIGEAQFDFHKKPRYQLSCVVDNFVFDKNGGIVESIEIEPNKNIKFLGIADLPIFRIIKTSYANEVCTLTLETEEETITNITKSIIEVL